MRAQERYLGEWAPQGSTIAATLLRLHIHLLYKYINREVYHLFADDLVLISPGSLEENFTANIPEIEARAAQGMLKLEKFSNDYELPVNVT